MSTSPDPQRPTATPVPEGGAERTLSGRDEAVLDDPVTSSLAGAHAHLAEGNALVRRFPADVSPFVAFPAPEDPGTPEAIRELFGPGEAVTMAHVEPPLPAHWEWRFRLPGVQLVETPALAPRPCAEAVELDAEDVPEMLDLTARTRPGPFLPRTHELGRYIGVRREGRLVAMTGERLHPAGWTEISAVAVDPSARRQGLASALVLDVAHGIRARGEGVFLHAAAENTGAIAAYEALGFALRREVVFAQALVPQD